ncbi:MAG: acyl-CoA dehydrogenase [Elusimicrobia bacterium GWC2_51_8]|nr:MAG: acyl-CoA dehydrogenase [Elusimicrobia bacterium GWA2_51_34]OGR59162.1 MAG: acyl-CoA dehydrogenase [Elusimicrobia bacterium GWC2_51_8]OGR88038.1 MAG: acyl-CoA dehydrogenase [Elusimicrobia bacterium GWF2_52_66]HAF94865.1 acyl-CoA dehydrogenase [Elusimicrobiota bacterium]HCE97177.1 acyl-CoA dehydrogenase [Elusimicrobiota bacterium]
MASIDAISRNLMLDSLREYAKRRLPFDFIRRHDTDNEFPAEILKEMYDPAILGVHLLMIPVKYGGVSGGTFDIYRVCEALARIDLGIATSVFATFLGTDPLNVGGTEEQKEKWLTKIAKERSFVAYAATEPDAGSDLVNLKTRAEHVVKNGKLTGYCLTGAKQWISNGGVADIYTVLALAPGGPSWFIVERDMEGFSPNKHEDKHGIRLSNTAGLSLDNVYVPVENLIGLEEGKGLLQAQAVFGYTRLMVAAFGLGAGLEAIEIAARYSQQRIQAGGPLSDKQGYTHKFLVPNIVRLEAARAYIEETANRLDSGEHGLQTEGAVAKYFATESGNKAAEDAIQALGGYGYTHDFAVEKIKRDVKITCIYEGTSEVLEMTIYRGRWQEHLKTRGRYYLDLADKMDALHTANADVGAEACALALRSLAAVLEECRVQKLTRHQHITFKLGRLITMGEAAYVFSGAAAKEKYSESVRFDAQGWRAMARVFAREAALTIAVEGAALVLGTAEGEVNLSVDVAGAAAAQKGLTADMDIVAAKLKQTFKAK